MRNLSKTAAWGFTLIEMLLVIAILAILASVVIIAINPVKQFADARNAQRLSDVYTLLHALHRYASDHDGAFPEEVTLDTLEICGTESLDCAGLHDLSSLTEGELYLVEVPTDPLCEEDPTICAQGGTGYLLYKTANGRMSISAPHAENGEEIGITR